MKLILLDDLFDKMTKWKAYQFLSDYFTSESLFKHFYYSKQLNKGKRK